MVAVVEVDYVAKKKMSKDSEDRKSGDGTKSVRIANDLAVLLQLIKAAHNAQGLSFNIPSFLDGLLRKPIQSEFARVSRFLPGSVE